MKVPSIQRADAAIRCHPSMLHHAVIHSRLCYHCRVLSVPARWVRSRTQATLRVLG